ncbi:unnamed protein product [Brachionus calyciflorus]|uniref:Sin3 histone deacetylase corepressor complex component SDS3 n=1 Tax=Brachionus calyciflorus TaxID=104777 RepID=A0A813RF47_9BILA|nr:unnamed protein product [Brachionus calyciflorus]
MPLVNKKQKISNKGSKKQNLFSSKSGEKNCKSKTISTIIGLKTSLSDQNNITNKRSIQDENAYSSKKMRLGKLQNSNVDFKKETIEIDEAENENKKVENNNKLIEIDLKSFSTEDLKLKEKYFEDKLKSLNEKLGKLKELGFLNRIENDFDIKENVNVDDNLMSFMREYSEEMKKLDRDCEDKLDGLKEWYKRERDEIDETFKLESKKAIQEFYAKRKELKENLKNEHEDKRKKIENDLNMLEINFDYYENKIFPTRKLRRRTTTNVNNPNFDFLIDASSLDIMY